MIDYYKILGVEPTATETEIKKQFRKLATIYHPDKNAGSKRSEEIFKEIVAAYDILYDRERRKKYDFQFKQRYSPPQTDYTHKDRQNQQPHQTVKKNHQKYGWKSSYTFWLVIVVILLIYVFNIIFRPTTTKNRAVDKELQEQEIPRPESGEINF